MKCHSWTEEDEAILKNAIDECSPIFDHFKGQGASYSDSNAWDAVAGRLLPDICVTGAACRRHFEKIKERESDGWKKTVELVNAYETDLAETTFDGVAEVLGKIDAIFDELTVIREEIADMKKAWE